jgi:hypothetical protein
LFWKFLKSTYQTGVSELRCYQAELALKEGWLTCWATEMGWLTFCEKFPRNIDDKTKQVRFAEAQKEIQRHYAKAFYIRTGGTFPTTLVFIWKKARLGH